MKKIAGILAIFIISLALMSNKEKDLDSTLQQTCGYRVNFSSENRRAEGMYLVVSNVYKAWGSTYENNTIGAMTKYGWNGQKFFWHKDRQVVSETR